MHINYLQEEDDGGGIWLVDKTKFLKTHWLILLWFGKNTDGQTADGQIIHIKKKRPSKHIAPEQSTWLNISISSVIPREKKQKRPIYNTIYELWLSHKSETIRASSV